MNFISNLGSIQLIESNIPDDDEATLCNILGEKNIFSCDICLLNFQNESEFMNHKIFLHDNAMEIKCEEEYENEYTADDKSIIEESTYKIKIEKLSHKCEYCSESFNLSSELSQHKCYNINDFNDKNHRRSNNSLSESSDPENTFTCEICLLIFGSESEYVNHKSIHYDTLGVVESKLKPEKGVEFDIRLNNSNQIDNEYRPHKCDYCSKCFKLSNHLVCHIRTHTGEKPYICSYCGKSFASVSSRKRHARRHTGEKPYVCEICEKRFHSSGELTKHIRGHTGERPYHCEFCEKRFKSSSELIVHRRCHTGDKPYLCKICGRAFRTSSHVNGHMRTHMEDSMKPKLFDKKHLCDTCGKAFSKLSQMQEHVRSHTGEKPFDCYYCGRLFSSTSSRNRHFRIHIKQTTNNYSQIYKSSYESALSHGSF